MAASLPFKVLLAVGIVATLGVKSLMSGGVQNPTGEDVAFSAARLLAAEGLAYIGPGQIGARPAVIFSGGGCRIAIIAVAHQGWHEAAVRQEVKADQKLWFVFDGVVYQDRQPTWQPMVHYYANKAMAYLGLNAPYPPVFAVVTDQGCTPGQFDWAKLPAVPFRRVGLIAG